MLLFTLHLSSRQAVCTWASSESVTFRSSPPERTKQVLCFISATATTGSPWTGQDAARAGATAWRKGANPILFYPRIMTISVLACVGLLRCFHAHVWQKWHPIPLFREKESFHRTVYFKSRSDNYDQSAVMNWQRHLLSLLSRIFKMSEATRCSFVRKREHEVK